MLTYYITLIVICVLLLYTIIKVEESKKWSKKRNFKYNKMVFESRKNSKFYFASQKKVSEMSRKELRICETAYKSHKNLKGAKEISEERKRRNSIEYSLGKSDYVVEVGRIKTKRKLDFSTHRPKRLIAKKKLAKNPNSDDSCLR